MIEKLSEQWSRIEEAVRPSVDRGEPEELEGILRQIVGVRDVLRRMCQVSVTRRTLREAVREALLPVIREHRDELFPELAELERRMKAVEEQERSRGVGAGEMAAEALIAPSAAEASPPDAFRDEFFRRLEEFEARIAKLSLADERAGHDLAARDERLDAAIGTRATREELEGLEGRVREDLTARGEQLAASARDDLAREISALETRRDERLAELRRELEEELRSGVLSIEEKLERVKSYLEQFEASVPETAKAAAGETEARLREEIESMMGQLTERLGEVRAFLERIEGELAPRRALLESLDQRLERLEGAFSGVSTRLEGIEAVTPEIRGIGDRFAELRVQVQEAARALETSTGDVRSTLGARLEELRRALTEGIARWEEDQSTMSERLSSMRDSLRDQLVDLGHQVGRDKGSLWNKLSGKKEASLKLSARDFEDLSTKLETIIGGLEGVIARKRES